jgi:hypothetical protein
MTTTWRKELDACIDWDDIESSTLTDEDLDREFDPGFGGSNGCSFTIWTSDRVYFPAVYDGSEWVEWVSRHPDTKPTQHVGGE